MKALLQQLRIYFIVSILAILVGCFFLYLVGKVQGHIEVNATHNAFQDFFFKYFTHLGGGTGVIVGTILLSVIYYKRYQISIVLLGAINLVLVAAITQILKQLVFGDALRPVKFIGEKLLYTVPGVEMNHYNSFPSGHTAAGFAFFAFVAYLFRKQPIAQFLCAIAAILVGYSRIYLSQHFLEDAVFGGTIGLGCFVMSYLIVSQLPLKKKLS